jgi:hypothetical protein
MSMSSSTDRLPKRSIKQSSSGNRNYQLCTPRTAFYSGCKTPRTGQNDCSENAGLVGVEQRLDSVKCKVQYCRRCMKETPEQCGRIDTATRCSVKDNLRIGKGGMCSDGRKDSGRGGTDTEFDGIRVPCSFFLL